MNTVTAPSGRVDADAPSPMTHAQGDRPAVFAPRSALLDEHTYRELDLTPEQIAEDERGMTAFVVDLVREGAPIDQLMPPERVREFAELRDLAQWWARRLHSKQSKAPFALAEHGVKVKWTTDLSKPLGQFTPASPAVVTLPSLNDEQLVDLIAAEQLGHVVAERTNVISDPIDRALFGARFAEEFARLAGHDVPALVGRRQRLEAAQRAQHPDVPSDVVAELQAIEVPKTWDPEARARLRNALVNALFVVNESEADVVETVANLLGLDPTEANELWTHVEFDPDLHLSERIQPSKGTTA